jgi:hypothetical protein
MIKIYKQNIKDLLEMIDYAIQSKKEMPSLILLYSGIDIMAWLGRNDESDVNVYFKEWVKQYLLPDSGLNCDENDLWGARCGIVHRFTAESNVTNSGVARQIFYVSGTGKAEDLQKYLDRIFKKDKAIAVHINDLNSSFKIAIQRFDKMLSKKHSPMSKIVSERSNMYFTRIPESNRLDIKE